MFRLVNKLKNKKGFTLIELIVVLAVLAVIMAIAVPRFLGVQENAKLDADYATGASIAKAAELYVAQNEDTILPNGIESKNLTETQVQDIIDSLGKVDFKSKDFNGYETKDKITISITSDGAITVVANSKTLYPK